MAGKHDETFLGILSDEGQVIPFLDSVFGFLYRCTDFFRIQNDPSERMGFPPGVAEQITLKVLRKWETKARLADENYYRQRDTSAEDCSPPIQEVEIDSEMCPSEEVTSSDTACSSSEPQERDLDESRKFSASDSYNGAVRSGYQWSQTVSDVDVRVSVPKWVTKAKQVNVKVEPDKLCVKLNDAHRSEGDDSTNILLEGELMHKTRREESTWTLIPGSEIHIHLEKVQEQWWESLLTSEEKINLQKIDATRPLNEYSQEEQMKIQELVWEQERKRKGEIDPRHQPVAEMLKKAWNQEGSPFKGMEYNPSMINFDGNLMPQ